MTKLAKWILVNVMTVLKNISPSSYLRSRILLVNVFQVHFLSFLPNFDTYRSFWKLSGKMWCNSAMKRTWGHSLKKMLDFPNTENCSNQDPQCLHATSKTPKQLKLAAIFAKYDTLRKLYVRNRCTLIAQQTTWCHRDVSRRCRKKEG